VADGLFTAGLDASGLADARPGEAEVLPAGAELARLAAPLAGADGRPVAWDGAITAGAPGEAPVRPAP